MHGAPVIRSVPANLKVDVLVIIGARYVKIDPAHLKIYQGSSGWRPPVPSLADLACPDRLDRQRSILDCHPSRIVDRWVLLAGLGYQCFIIVDIIAYSWTCDGRPIPQKRIVKQSPLPARQHFKEQVRIRLQMTTSFLCFIP